MIGREFRRDDNMTDQTVRVSAEALTNYAIEVFTATGMSPENAGTVAEVLVWANLRGVDSHGVLRIPRYLNLHDMGRMNPTPSMRITDATAATFVVDADRAPGPVAMTYAMNHAIPKAREAGIGWGLVRETSHAAAVGYYILIAAREHMAGIATVASTPNMAYHGARSAGVSTTAIAIAVPGATHPPLMLDMAAVVAAIGKLMQARNSRSPIPEGWALTADGRPTTDADEAVVPMPLGGPKGAGLALMVECLTSLLVDGPILSSKLFGAETGDRHRQNALVVAIDIAAFVDVELYGRNVDRLVAGIKSLPKADGIDEILVPGEHGDRILKERERDGIPMPPGTWKGLVAAAERFGLNLPSVC